MTERRVAIVTGAASGMGRATALRLARDGFRVMMVMRKGRPGDPVPEELDGGGHRTFYGDISEESSIIRIFDTVEADVGPVSALLLFAAAMGSGTLSVPQTLANQTLGEWQTLMDTNVRGAFIWMREMERHRRAHPVPHGRIVPVASFAGQIGGVVVGAAYSASKGALIALAKFAARDLAPTGITVNVISPGAIDTPMLASSLAPGIDKTVYTQGMPLGRLGLPEEVAAAASFLVATDAGFVTGHTLDVNGGFVMR